VKDTTLLVVDTETGGLDPEVACIIEIAAQVLVIEPPDENGVFDFGNLQPGEMFYAKIKPDRPVGEKAAAVNGYLPEAWHDALMPDVGLGNFRRFVERECKKARTRPMWCGCNPLFDLKFYNGDRKRYGQAAPDGLSYRVIDVQSLAFPLLFCGELTGLSLAKLRAWAGIEGEQKHTALDDVHDTCEVIGALLRWRFDPS